MIPKRFKMWRVLMVLVVCQVWSVHCQTEEVYSWESLSFSFPGGTNESEYLADGRYVPANLQFSDIAVYKYHKLVALPRLRGGVPFVLANMGTQLHPWPNYYDKHRPGNCTELQNPLALQMDHDNEILYALDNGRINIHTDNPDNTCPPKILAYNMTISRDKGRVILSQNLDPSVVNSNSVLLSFVLSRPRHNGPFPKHAFIADGATGMIIVHDFEQQVSWGYHDSRMTGIMGQNVSIHEASVKVRYGINALAMSPQFNYVYFTCTGSQNFYQIPVDVLVNRTSGITTHIRLLSSTLGTTQSFVNSMLSGQKAVYFSAQERKDIRHWPFQDDMAQQGLTYPYDTGATLMKQTTGFLRGGKFSWPYSMALDSSTTKLFYWASNKPELLYEGDFKQFYLYENSTIFYKVVRYQIDDKSYLHDVQSPVG